VNVLALGVGQGHTYGTMLAEGWNCSTIGASC